LAGFDDPADKAIWGEDSEVGGDSMPETDIEVDASPPVGRVAADDSRGLEAPMDALWITEHASEAIVLDGGVASLEEFEAEAFIFQREVVQA
jgi:hypothetical protein